MQPPNCVLISVLLMIADGFIVHGPAGPLVAPPGSSVALPCYVDELLVMEDLEVEWRRTDSGTLVHLYQDGESRPEVQQQDYHERAHFFTDQIQHGNLSLRLDNLRAEDEGRYTCRVYSQQDSGETVVQLKYAERLLVSGSDESISASVGEDVTLSCSVDSHITPEHIEEVSWIKTDEDILVLLYQNNETFSDSAHEQYRGRVEFFTAEIPKGNFSLRLKSVRTEDKGVYMCLVFAGGLSANATVVLERLGFSVSSIMILLVCISASGSALLLCCLIYCRSPTKGLLVQQLNNFFPLGSSVVLPCCVDKLLLKKNLKVEWRRIDSETLVHLYQDGESRAEKQSQDYHNRAHFFSDQFQHGNFSLRLDNLRAEDEGRYTCRVYSDQDCVYSAEINLAKQFKVKSSSVHQTVALGGSVGLLCRVDKNLLQNSLKVEWKRADLETLVHLYQDGQSRLNKQDKDYHHRAHFLNKKIKDGNFSLRLEKLSAEDAGKYKCKVFIDEECVHSADTEVILGFNVKCSRHTPAFLGASAVLPCYVEELSSMEGLKVEWRKTNSDALVHLYQDGESRPEAQHKDYHHRAHFFTDQIQHGNFSLRLDNLRAEDEGRYTCRVYTKKEYVISAESKLIPRLQDLFFYLQMFLVFCPNILMFLAFVLWGVSEGSLNESVSCCALYFLRPLLLLWVAPYVHEFITGYTATWILNYNSVVEYIVLLVVVYSALFASVWEKLVNYAEFDRFSSDTMSE
ncbi:butyrophilin-like protein 2 [Cyprinus carpio]|uniref:Butyrophilin-like protein 2 n=1 Tax=Cyprinus carpio TaxID=7962 RepID=A0A9Q9VUU4_CYPCA|nr:butyrophilin-like protein 2 [Cyprinus carpio]